jgi:hypothetical protein
MIPYRLIVAITLAILLPGCVGFTKSSGECYPGYSEEARGEHMFLVSYGAPRTSTAGTLKRLVAKRAAQLCVSGYEIIHFETTEEECIHRNPPSYSSGAALIKCNPH